MACLASPKGAVPADFGTAAFAKRQTVDFQGSSGRVMFDKLGNRKTETANFLLSNIIVAKDSTVPANLNLMGQYDPTKAAWVFDKKKTFQYAGGATKPPTDTVVPTHNKGFVAPGMKAFSYILAGISVTLGLIFMLWTITHRNTKVVRYSQPEFLVAICVGCMISSLSIIPVNMDDHGADDTITGFERIVTPPNVNFETFNYPYVQFSNATGSPKGALDTSCMLSLWLYSLGFVLTFGSLFAKVYRVSKIFGGAKQLMRAVVKSKDMILPIAGVLVLDAAVLLAWTMYNPLKWYRFVLTEDQYKNPLTSIGKCDTTTRLTESSSGWLFLTPLALIHFVVLVVGNVLSYRSRNIATAYQEGKYIAMAMVSNLQVLALSIPVLLIVADNAAASSFVRSAVVFLNDIGVLSFVFIPKILSLHYGWSSGDGTRSFRSRRGSGTLDSSLGSGSQTEGSTHKLSPVNPPSGDTVGRHARKNQVAPG